MTSFVTRVSVWFNSEGASPAVVIEKLLELGFTAIRGAYDFVYEHSQENMSDADLMDAIIEISNALHKTLSGFKVLYTLDTQPKEDADYIPLKDIDAELASLEMELKELDKEAKSE